MSEFRRITEEASLYDHLEMKSSLEIIQEINQEDQKVALAVQELLPQIAAFLDEALPRMQAGARLFYVGAGTSGRLGVLDASEIPPTFGMPPDRVIGLIAGGDRALRNPVEGAEDDDKQAWIDLAPFNPQAQDILVGVAASGTTPYVIAALKRAQTEGLLTACICSNPSSPLSQYATYPFELMLGPEYISGSSRMKSGTAQKMILNMISTRLMIGLGRIRGNKMVHMQLSNQKLVNRGTHMLMDQLGLSEGEAESVLLQYGSVQKAIESFRKKN